MFWLLLEGFECLQDIFRKLLPSWCIFLMCGISCIFLVPCVVITSDAPLYWWCKVWDVHEGLSDTSIWLLTSTETHYHSLEVCLSKSSIHYLLVLVSTRDKYPDRYLIKVALSFPHWSLCLSTVCCRESVEPNWTKRDMCHKTKTRNQKRLKCFSVELWRKCQFSVGLTSALDFP